MTIAWKNINTDDGLTKASVWTGTKYGRKVGITFFKVTYRYVSGENLLWKCLNRMQNLNLKIRNEIQNAHSFRRRRKKDIMCLWCSCTLKGIWATQSTVGSILQTSAMKCYCSTVQNHFNSLTNECTYNFSTRSTPSHCSTTHPYTTRYAATTPLLQIRIELWIL